jgi:AmiR/NasT family two-component response regulator
MQFTCGLTLHPWPSGSVLIGIVTPPAPTTDPAAVLVVADDRELRASLGETLRGDGLRVTAVGTHSPAIATVDASAGFDLVLLDVQPPDGTALAVARHLLGSGDTPLVVLTSAASSVFPDEELPAGPVTQMARPPDPKQLLRTLRGLLAIHREHKRLRAENEQLARAVGQARDINVVVGILMERFGLDRAHAFEALRRQSRARRMKLADLAASLMAAEERLHAFGAHLGRDHPS